MESLFVFIALLAVGLTSTAISAIVCPQMCTCQQPNDGSLVIDCGGRKTNACLLYDAVDLLLSEVKLGERLTSLQISNTSLRQAPLSVCRLSKLTSLNLDRNRLVRLPNNCFNNMTQLQVLSAAFNIISQLQDGLFDGLNFLKNLNFLNNHISSIGFHVFSNPNDLVNLAAINLDNNRLQSLEPWPYIRGLTGPPAVVITIAKNRISTFTNKIGWQFQCAQRSYAKVFITWNYIQHISDIFTGWNVLPSRSAAVQLLCLLHHSKFTGNVRDFFIDFSHSRNYHCDCRDFEYYKFHLTILSRLRCSEPSGIVKQSALSVPLIDIVCELWDRCPSGCRCVYRPANATLHVNCAAANLSALPFDLPPLPKSYDRYKLDFSENKLLRRLDYRSYFVNTSVLDVSSCAVDHVDLSAWRELARMQSLFVVPTIYLHKNQLNSLSHEVSGVNLSSVCLTLGNNPWKCSCANGWMIGWFKSLRSAVSQDDDVNALCASPSRLEGRLITQSTEYDFCVDPTERVLKISLSSTLSIVAVLLMSGCVIYRLRVPLYKRFKFHPFNRDECVDEDMDFDVYLCCSSEDHNPYGLHILEMIESRGYRVCYHLRDFLAGGAITENMIQSVVRSKRTVCLVSNNFLQRLDIGLGFCTLFTRRYLLAERWTSWSKWIAIAELVEPAWPVV